MKITELNTYNVKVSFVNHRGETRYNAITVKAGNEAWARKNAISELKSLHAIHNPTILSITNGSKQS